MDDGLPLVIRFLYTYPQPVTPKTGSAPWSNFNRYGWSIFARRQQIITPNTDLSPASNSLHEAEYATLSGSAKVGNGSGSGYSGTAYVDGYAASTDAETTFTMTAKDNGYHAIRLHYAAG